MAVAGAAAGRLAHYTVSGVVGGLIIRGLSKRLPDGTSAARKAVVGGIAGGIVAGRWLSSAAEEAPPPSAVTVEGHEHDHGHEH
jgi:hypothetical protein